MVMNWWLFSRAERLTPGDFVADSSLERLVWLVFKIGFYVCTRFGCWLASDLPKIHKIHKCLTIYTIKPLPDLETPVASLTPLSIPLLTASSIISWTLDELPRFAIFTDLIFFDKYRK